MEVRVEMVQELRRMQPFANAFCIGIENLNSCLNPARSRIQQNMRKRKWNFCAREMCYSDILPTKYSTRRMYTSQKSWHLSPLAPLILSFRVDVDIFASPSQTVLISIRFLFQCIVCSLIPSNRVILIQISVYVATYTSCWSNCKLHLKVFIIHKTHTRMQSYSEFVAFHSHSHFVARKEISSSRSNAINKFKNESLKFALAKFFC